MKTFYTLAVALTVLLSACGGEDKKTAETKPKDSTASVAGHPIDTSAFVAPSNAPADETVALQFNLQKGKKYEQTMSIEAKRQMEERSMGSDASWSYSMEVTEVINQIKTIKTTYKQMSMSMDMGFGGQKMEFSSEKKVEGNNLMQLPSRIFSAMKGKSFFMKVNEKGEIISVEGFDEIAASLAKEMQLPEAQQEMMLQTFQRQFSDEQTKKMFSSAFNFFPGKPVKLGDSWSRTSDMSEAAGLKTNTTYTVRNIRDGKVYLDLRSKIEGEENLSGTETGKMIVDAKTGLVLDALITQEIKGQGKTTTKNRITGKIL